MIGRSTSQRFSVQAQGRRWRGWITTVRSRKGEGMSCSGSWALR